MLLHVIPQQRNVLEDREVPDKGEPAVALDRHAYPSVRLEAGDLPQLEIAELYLCVDGVPLDPRDLGVHASIRLLDARTRHEVEAEPQRLAGRIEDGGHLEQVPTVDAVDV